MQTTLQTAERSNPLGVRFLGFWNTFKKSRTGVLGLVMLTVIILVAIFAPLLAPYGRLETVSISDIYKPPSALHLFGTDDAGQDVFSNFVFGARVSLTVGFFAAFISIIIGGTFGLGKLYYALHRHHAGHP
jgi:peptide/nickel transport system permease protein